VRTLPVSLLLIGGLLLSLPPVSHGEGKNFRAQSGPEEAPVSNMTVIIGKVLKNSVAPAGSHCLGSGDVLYLMVISLKDTEDVPGYENFLRDVKGRTMAFFTAQKPSNELQGKKIRALVMYKGDRSCRLYWIEDIEIVQQ
jgi:hypothetical protein